MESSTSPESSTRNEIVAAADDLFYRQGFEHTSFAHIAAAVKISRGNFYHHFKSKDDILRAVIDKRLADRRAMMAEWTARHDDPRDRLYAFIDILKVNGAKIRRHGCPIGTLCSELAKLNHQAQNEAKGLFTLFDAWLSEQFTLLGHGPRSGRLAMRLLSETQGVATMFNAFGEVGFVDLEISRMKAWVAEPTL